MYIVHNANTLFIFFNPPKYKYEALPSMNLLWFQGGQKSEGSVQEVVVYLLATTNYAHRGLFRVSVYIVRRLCKKKKKRNHF